MSHEAGLIPFAKPWIGDAEREAVAQVLASGVLTHGPQAHAFENEFAEYLGPGAHCVAVSSGMAALHLAYSQLGVGSGDEVIVAAETHVATAHAVEQVGARPVFADCDARTGNIDPGRIESLITPRTRAIGLVHFLGIPCNMDAIMDIANRHGLRVIEDCALAVGARWKDRHVGLFGDAGAFSFYPTKHITSGEGGMFVSRDADLAAKVAKARGFGIDRTYAERAVPGIYDAPSLGLNYRMSDINAAIARKQLERIDTITEIRRNNYNALRAQLNGRGTVLEASGPDALSAHYCLSIVLDEPGRRNAIVARLNAAGIGTSVYYPHPVPRLAYYRAKYEYDAHAYRMAERISDGSIALPVGPHLNREEMIRIATMLADIFTGGG